MKYTKNILSLSILILLLSLTSCGKLVLSKVKSKVTVENRAIPPDFGKNDDNVLLCVITGNSSYDKYMKKHVVNEYHGKYEFVLQKELSSAKFSDKSKYRFVFNRKQIRKSRTTYNPSTGHSTNDLVTSHYFILDRAKNITYKSPMTSSFFSKLIQGYMINLEEKRLKEQ